MRMESIRVGGVLQILELPVEESSYPGPIRSQGRSLPSRSALACLISRRVEAWRYQGQRSSDVTKEHVLSQRLCCHPLNSQSPPQIQAVVLGPSQADVTKLCFDTLLLAGPRGNSKRLTCFLIDGGSLLMMFQRTLF